MEPDTRQLLAKLEETNRLLGAQARWLKGIALLLAVLLAASLVFMAAVWVQAREVCSALESVDWNALARRVASLDVEGINDTVGALQEAAAALNGLGQRFSSLFGG